MRCRKVTGLIRVIVIDTLLPMTKVSTHHTPNIEVLCSYKGFDVEISSSNTPPRELYRITLSESNDKT